MKKTIVLLGSSISALAVARHAGSLGYRPVVLDTGNGVALSTSVATCERIPGRDGDALARILEIAGEGAGASLMATSDRWLRFMVNHREALDAAYGSVLHPSNEIIETCLDKVLFTGFCETRKLPVPRPYSEDEVADLCGRGAALPHPILLRPARSGGAGVTGVPKAVEAAGVEELQTAFAAFRSAGAAVSGTESLLGRDPTQYSVGFVRTGDQGAYALMRKVRPSARACAVGTLVESVDPSRNRDVISLATRLADELGYYGIGEAEVLKTGDGKLYLIELNARPWIQYDLARVMGYDFLSPLIEGNPAPPPGRFRRCSWICFSEDLYSVFSRTEGALKHGETSIAAWVTSLLKRPVPSVFSFRDIPPVISCLRRRAG